MGTQKSPLVSISKSWSFMTWMIWGNPILGNPQVYGKKPSNVLVLCSLYMFIPFTQLPWMFIPTSHTMAIYSTGVTRPLLCPGLDLNPVHTFSPSNSPSHQPVNQLFFKVCVAQICMPENHTTRAQNQQYTTHDRSYESTATPFDCHRHMEV